jgi:hypothetical protein
MQRRLAGARKFQTGGKTQGGSKGIVPPPSVKQNNIDVDYLKEYDVQKSWIDKSFLKYVPGINDIIDAIQEFVDPVGVATYKDEEKQKRFEESLEYDPSEREKLFPDIYYKPDLKKGVGGGGRDAYNPERVFDLNGNPDAETLDRFLNEYDEKGNKSFNKKLASISRSFVSRIFDIATAVLNVGKDRVPVAVRNTISKGFFDAKSHDLTEKDLNEEELDYTRMLMMYQILEDTGKEGDVRGALEGNVGGGQSKRNKQFSDGYSQNYAPGQARVRLYEFDADDMNGESIFEAKTYDKEGFFNPNEGMYTNIVYLLGTANLKLVDGNLYIYDETS